MVKFGPIAMCLVCCRATSYGAAIRFTDEKEISMVLVKPFDQGTFRRVHSLRNAAEHVRITAPPGTIPFRPPVFHDKRPHTHPPYLPLVLILCDRFAGPIHVLQEPATANTQSQTQASTD